MKFKRPEDFPYPYVWSRFTRTNAKGETMKFKIQDCPEEMFPDLMEFMCEYFMKDETLNNAVGIQYDNLAVEEFITFQSAKLLQKLVTICLRDEDNENNFVDKKPKILGFSLTFVQRDGEEDDFQPKSNAIIKLFKVFNEMENHNLTRKTFGVDEYLGDAGLSVHPSARNLGIGVELLKSRISIARMLGLKVVEATFTSDTSQASASKAGYSTMVSVPYAELSTKYNIDFQTSSKCINIMTYFVD